MNPSKRKTSIFTGGRFNLPDGGYALFVRNRTYGTVVMLLETTGSFYPNATVRSATIAAKWTPRASAFSIRRDKIRSTRNG
jgi:hypothetical protein